MSAMHDLLGYSNLVVAAKCLYTQPGPYLSQINRVTA